MNPEDTPLISVVMAVYNGADYLDEAKFRSIFFKNFLIIICPKLNFFLRLPGNCMV
jgi:hypothetical protein